MISKEEMYEFASQIAGITDADLEAYKCGGKAKKKAEGGWLTKKVNSSMQRVKERVKMEEDTKKQQEKLRKEKELHPERFNENGSRKYNKNDDLPTNEDVKQDWMKKKRKK